MTAAAVTPLVAKDERPLSIGEVADLLGTTTRTLRYYGQLGLVKPSRLTETAQRRYEPEDVQRLRSIRELQSLLGLELDEIAEYLKAYDRLDGLKAEYRAGPPPDRRDEILHEGLAILERLLQRVHERQAGLSRFAAELETRLGKYHTALAENPGRLPPAKR